MQKTNNIRILFLILFLGTGCLGYAQFGVQQIISTEASAPRRIVTADVDGDGDQDILSASFGDNTIAWYENIDGNGSFGTIQVISNTLTSTQHLFAADIDGDNDIDVVANSRVDDILVWYKNLDGLGDFSTALTISASVLNPKGIFVSDLDGDNDLDVILASADDNKVAWYENLDGEGAFGTERIISTALSDAFAIYGADLDGDNDIDIVATANGTQQIFWFRNLNGQGDFGAPQEISNSSFGVVSVFVGDLNNDEDNDVLSALGGGYNRLV